MFSSCFPPLQGGKTQVRLLHQTIPEDVGPSLTLPVIAPAPSVSIHFISQSVPLSLLHRPSQVIAIPGPGFQEEPLPPLVDITDMLSQFRGTRTTFGFPQRRESFFHIQKHKTDPSYRQENMQRQ